MLRAVQVSLGGLVAQRTGPSAGGISDSAVIIASAPARPISFHPAVKLTRAALQAGRAVHWGKPYTVYFPNTAITPPFLYLPMVVPILIGRASRMPVDDTLLSTRLVLVTCAAALGAAALLLAVRLRIVLLLVLTLPMTVALSAAVNPDGTLIPLSCLVAALLDRARNLPDVPLSRRWFVLFGVSLAVVVLARPTNLPLALLPVLLPKPHRRLGLALALGLAAASVSWTTWMTACISVPLVEADPSRQAAFVLHHPIRFLLVMTATLQQLGFFYVQGMIGYLGWLDTLLPRWFYRISEAVAALTLVTAARQDAASSWTWRLPALLCATTAACLVFLTLYLGWTKPGADIVLGVQGRYMLSLWPALALGIPPLGGWTRFSLGPALTAVLLLAAVSPAVTVGTLVSRYYLAF
jgi:uncharacterized membrane protein